MGRRRRDAARRGGVGRGSKEAPREVRCGSVVLLGWVERQGGRPATVFIAASGREGSSRARAGGPTSWLGWPKP